MTSYDQTTDLLGREKCQHDSQNRRHNPLAPASISIAFAVVPFRPENRKASFSNAAKHIEERNQLQHHGKR